MKNPKRKGSQFEREIAKVLSQWWDDKKYQKGELIFWRTHASGGASHLSSQQFGDITFINPDGKPLIDLFVIECKRTRRFNLFGIIAGDKSLPLWNWLTKLKKEASSIDKYGWLIFKLDRFPIMCAIEVPISKRLSNGNNLHSKKVLRLYKPFPFDFYLLDEFLSVVSPGQIKDLTNSKE